MIRKLTIDEAIYAVSIAAELLNYDEPMPVPTEKRLLKLEACLEIPFTSFGGRYLYWTLSRRSAILFYHVIKNHPLENGNKRTAVILVMLFLFVNGKTLRIPVDDFYRIACDVADSKAKKSEEEIMILTKLFKVFTVDL